MVTSSASLTHPQPVYLGAVGADGGVLPGKVLVDARAPLQVAGVPVVWGLELLSQILQYGHAVTHTHTHTHPTPTPTSL